MQKMETERAPKAIGPYSQAIAANNFLFVSGQLPIEPKAGKIVDPTIEGQTRQVLQNLEEILKAAHLDFKNVVRVDIFLKDLEHFRSVNELYAQKFSHPIKPVRQTVQVARLPLDALIEISCIAALG